jgi:hypothetical protein
VVLPEVPAALALMVKRAKAEPKPSPPPQKEPKNHPYVERYVKAFRKIDVPSQTEFFEALNSSQNMQNRSQRLLFWSAGPPSNPKDPTLSSETPARNWAEAPYSTDPVFWLRGVLPQRYLDMPKSWRVAGTYSSTATKLDTIYWERASRVFALCARGIVRVILKEPCTKGCTFPVPTDCWAKDEWPIVTGINIHVTEVWRYEADGPWDAQNQCFTRHAVIWTREHGIVMKPMALS